MRVSDQHCELCPLAGSVPYVITVREKDRDRAASVCAGAHCSSRSDVRSSNSSAGHWALLAVRTFAETQDYVSFLFVLVVCGNGWFITPWFSWALSVVRRMPNADDAA